MGPPKTTNRDPLPVAWNRIRRCAEYLLISVVLMHVTLARAEDGINPATGITPAAAIFVYKGMKVDEGQVAIERRPALESGLREQIDLVRSLPIRPEIAEFLRRTPVRIDPTLHESGHYDQTGLRFSAMVVPVDNPVLLHELLHAWLSQSSNDERRKIRRAFDEARASGHYPVNAYMLSTPAEFFAMTTSVVLWGRAARAPFTRDRVRIEMPSYFRWLVETFGLDLSRAS